MFSLASWIRWMKRVNSDVATIDATTRGKGNFKEYLVYDAERRKAACLQAREPVCRIDISQQEIYELPQILGVMWHGASVQCNAKTVQLPNCPNGLAFPQRACCPSFTRPSIPPDLFPDVLCESLTWSLSRPVISVWNTNGSYAEPFDSQFRIASCASPQRKRRNINGQL